MMLADVLIHHGELGSIATSAQEAAALLAGLVAFVSLPIQLIPLAA